MAEDGREKARRNTRGVAVRAILHPLYVGVPVLK